MYSNWLYLAVAIVTEVMGTAVMRFALDSEPLLGYLIMFAMIGLSYYFLGLAVVRIPIGVAYAIWEGLGLSLVTVVGYFYFGESLSLPKVVGLAAIVGGVMLLKSGIHPPAAAVKSKRAPAPAGAFSAIRV